MIQFRISILTIVDLFSGTQTYFVCTQQRLKWFSRNAYAVRLELIIKLQLKVKYEYENRLCPTQDYIISG